MIREHKQDELEYLWNYHRDRFPNPVPFWQFRETIEKGKVLISEIQGEWDLIIEGFLISLIDQDEPWIWDIYTKPWHRNRGVGSALLNEIEKHYKGYKRICLYVAPDNPAQKLYFDLGYRVIEVVDHVYETGPALKMVKNLI